MGTSKSLSVDVRDDSPVSVVRQLIKNGNTIKVTEKHSLPSFAIPNGLKIIHKEQISKEHLLSTRREENEKHTQSTLTKLSKIPVCLSLEINGFRNRHCFSERHCWIGSRFCSRFEAVTKHV